MTPVRGSPSARGTSASAARGGAKPKTTTTSPRKAKPAAASKPSVHEPATNGNGAEHHEDVVEAHSAEEGAGEGETHVPEEEVHEEVHEDEVHEDEVHEEEIHEQAVGESGLDSEPQEHEHNVSVQPEQDESQLLELEPESDHHGEGEGDSTPVNASSGDKSQLEVLSSHQEQGNDIEDMVNLLEFGKPRPISIVAIPDESDVYDIPDEE